MTGVRRPRKYFQPEDDSFLSDEEESIKKDEGNGKQKKSLSTSLKKQQEAKKPTVDKKAVSLLKPEVEKKKKIDSKEAVQMKKNAIVSPVVDTRQFSSQSGSETDCSMSYCDDCIRAGAFKNKNDVVTDEETDDFVYYSESGSKSSNDNEGSFKAGNLDFLNKGGSLSNVKLLPKKGYSASSNDLPQVKQKAVKPKVRWLEDTILTESATGSDTSKAASKTRSASTVDITFNEDSSKCSDSLNYDYFCSRPQLRNPFDSLLERPELQPEKKPSTDDVRLCKRVKDPEPPFAINKSNTHAYCVVSSKRSARTWANQLLEKFAPFL